MRARRDQPGSGPGGKPIDGADDMTTTLDWYGCATFRLKTAGLTIFLDAYIDRAENAPGTGLARRRHRQLRLDRRRAFPLRSPLRRRADRRQHERPTDRQLRDRARDGAGRRARRSDDLRGRRRDDRARPGRARLRLSEPALLRVVPRPDGRRRRGLHRRSRGDLAAAARALRRNSRSTSRRGSIRSRSAT